MIDTPQADESRRWNVAQSWLANFEAALDAKNSDLLADLFMADSYWRDLLSHTWDIQTRIGAHEIAAALSTAHHDRKVTGLILEDRTPSMSSLGGDREVIEAFFGFQSAAGRGRGFVRLAASEDEPATFRAWTLLTSLQELHGYPPRVGRLRPRGPAHSPVPEQLNWLEKRAAEQAFADADPDVLIVGAGQAGLTLAARLGQLDVSTLVIDRAERVGDNWRKRYHSLRLHNEISVNHMPYLPFPDTWPVFIPKDMLADWFEAYVKALELNVWTRTEFIGGEYDEDERRWEVRLREADGAVRLMRPRQLVMAIGLSGIPSVPKLAGCEEFSGVIVHSSGYSTEVDVRGQRAVVVGSGTSAHDIAQDLYVRGADVTMLQRSSVTVVSVEPSARRVYATYIDNEGVLPVDDIDMMSASVPNALLKQMHVALSKQMADDDRELLDGLRRAGFLLDNGEDDTGFFIKSQRYFGKYYLNVGASDLIVDGRIKVVSGFGVARILPDGLELENGSVEMADLIVMATGYLSLQEGVRRLLGDTVADLVGPIWGLGEDGELRNMWKRTSQKGLWVLGGSFAQARTYSRYAALQIRAALDGLIHY